MLAKTNAKKLFVSTLLIGLFFASLVSMALAIQDENPVPADDGQMLIAPAPEDETGSIQDENPVLIQPRDDVTNSTDSSTTPTGEKQEEEPNLIASNTSPDATIVLGGTIALAAAIAVVASFAVLRRRSK